MENIMMLKEAIKQKHISIGTETIRYEPDYGKLTIKQERSGVIADQNFTTNKLSWKLIRLKTGKLALLAVTSTRQHLVLAGITGAKNCKKVINDICNLWSCKRLNLTAKGISKNNFENLPNSVKSALKGIILSSHENLKTKNNYKEIIFQIQKNYVQEFVLFSEKKGESSLIGQVRPIVYLPDNIVIDISTKTLYKDYNEVAKMKIKELIEKIDEGKGTSKEIVNQLIEILNIL